MIAISLGGSLLWPDGFDVEYVVRLSRLLPKRCGIVVGAGRLGRIFVDALRSKGVCEYRLDEIAVGVTHVNARAVAPLMNAVYCPTLEQAIDQSMRGRAVTGGTHPGHTTDTVSVLLAEAIGAKRWVNLTNVRGIYDRPPSEKGARLLSRLTYDELIELISRLDRRTARTNVPIDLLAAKLLARSGIEGHVVDGRDLRTVKRALAGKAHSGTVIRARKNI